MARQARALGLVERSCLSAATETFLEDASLRLDSTGGTAVTLLYANPFMFCRADPEIMRTRAAAGDRPSSRRTGLSESLAESLPESLSESGGETRRARRL